MSSEPLPTAEQRATVGRPADNHLLVTAEAGSGKTFSLVHRLEFLIQHEELSAAEILVLTFSRAAIRAIRERVAKHDESAWHVDIRTFDSYATWLLDQHEPNGVWTKGTYDRRIRAAVELLRGSTDLRDTAGHLRHLVVDEVQDLVGDRAELAKLLLQSLSGGFTLFGDPAQGIYGFQLEDVEARLYGSAAFYEWIRTTYAASLVETTLTQGFRAREPEARVASPFGPLLVDADADFATIHRGLRTALLKSHSLGTISDALETIGEFVVPTAVLCRNNGQALLISRELYRADIPHRLQRSAQDRVVPAWVGKMFGRLDSKRPSRDEITTFLAAEGLAVDEMWDLLKRMDNNRRSSALDLTMIRDRLARRSVTDELVQQAPALLVVSTVHRAKGLEFDQVVVVDPLDVEADEIQLAESARALYVAMTRPRDLLMHIGPSDGLTKGRLTKIRGGRWTDCGYGKYPNGRYGMEAGADDVHGQDPAGTVGYYADAANIQDYLYSIRPGASVTLVLHEDRTLTAAPAYRIEHEGTIIGVTSETFAGALRAGLPGRDRSVWPTRIHDIRIDCIETVVGSAAASINVGLGWSGVWVCPRLTGLGRFDWGKVQS